MHDVSGYGGSDGVDKSEATRKGESFGFPRSHFVMDLVDDKTKSSFVSLVYSKVFSEISRGGDSELIFHVRHIGG